MEALSNYKYIFAAALLALLSCQKDDTCDIYSDTGVSRNVSINATISGNTKTSLDGLNVIWNKDDAIDIFTSANRTPSGFVLESGEGTSCAIFKGNLSGKAELAKYPYDASDIYDKGTISTKIPETQTYVHGTFGSGFSPMVGMTDGNGNFSFSNVCSVLRLTLTGIYNVEEIILTSDDKDCYLAGPAKIKFVGGKPILETDGEGYQSVHLDCQSTPLSSFVFTSFVIVVPSQVYESGLRIDVYTNAGKHSKHTGKLDLKSSTLYDIEPFEVTINGNIEPSPYLKGKGTTSSPFLVSSVADLLHMKNAMSNDGEITKEDGTSAGTPARKSCYLLTEDLDIGGCCGPETGSWSQLVPDYIQFTGQFDGGGHKITGLYINNTTDGLGSFFGEIFIDGYLCNLEVVGDVKSEVASIVCADVYGTLENCIARGSANGSRTASGVANSNYGKIRNCVNYAEVTNAGTMYNSTGGIATYCNGCVFDNCINYGNITATTGKCRAAGIAGSIQESKVLNCNNYGEITGVNNAAGIVGQSFDTEIRNCANYGNVHGSDKTKSLCAGICSEFIDPFSTKTGIIENCINVGKVDGGLQNYGICSNNELQIKYCYWLNTVSSGVNGGTQIGLCSLSESQMKGESNSPSLYSGYRSPVDALNACGFENSTSEFKFQGWMYDSKTGWPVMTGRPALPPGEIDKYIKTNPSGFTLNTFSQSIKLTVMSTAEVSITLPNWIKENNHDDELDGTVIYTTYVLDVAQNKTGSERTGTIAIQSTDDCTAEVAVNQSYTYVSEDFSRDGKVVTVQKATKGLGIDIVLMGDAYTDKDIKNGTYDSDIRRGIDGFFSVEPYATFKDFFNIYYVEVVSATNEIGFSTALDTYFGSGTHVGGDNNKVRTICGSVTKKNNLDDVTAIVLINTKKYAGTCWMYYPDSGECGLGFSVSYFPLGTTTTGMTSMEAIIRHEAAGHGFGKLSDEYAYQSWGTIPTTEVNEIITMQGYGWWPNVDFISDPFKIRWSKYIRDNRYASEQIGAYEGGATYWSGVWRPTENSIMRYNTGQFNAPSREAIYYKIHRLAYGSSWEYDHEEFVKYDAINRSSVALSAGSLSPWEAASFIPTHPPVIVK